MQQKVKSYHKLLANKYGKVKQTNGYELQQRVVFDKQLAHDVIVGDVIVSDSKGYEKKDKILIIIQS